METQVLGQRRQMVLFSSFLLFYLAMFCLYFIVRISQNNGFLEILSIAPKLPSITLPKQLSSLCLSY